MTDIQLPDGSFIRIPNYALESTQEKILKAMEAQLGKNSAALKHYKELVENAAKTAKSTDKHQKFQVKNSSSMAQTLKGLLDETVESNKRQRFATAAGRDLASSFRYVGKLGAASVVAAGALARLAKESVIGFGSALTELTQQGVGLTDVRGSAMELLGTLQGLGFSTTEAANTMATFGRVVQTAGKREFANLQQEFARITRFGSEFGMTMSEASEILNEDLELRQRLGILQSLDHHQQARMSRDLFEMQLRSAAVLGRSIDEIRKLSMDVMDDPIALITAQQIGARHNEKAMNRFVNAIQQTTTELASLSIDDALVQALMQQVQAVVPFADAAGTELFAALQAIGEPGQRFAAEIQRINHMISRAGMGDEEALAQFHAARGDLFKGMQQLGNLTTEEITTARLLMSGQRNQFLEMLASTSRVIPQALRNLDAATDAQVDGLMESSAAFRQAFKQVRGVIQQIFTTLVSGFSEPMKNFASAFTKGEDGVKSVLTTLTLASGSISDALRNVLGRFIYLDHSSRDLRTRLNSLVEQIRDTVIVYIERFGDYLERIGGPGALFEKFSDGIGRAIGAVTAMVRFFERLNWKTVLTVAIAIPLVKALAVGLTAALGKALVARTIATRLGQALASRGLLGVAAKTAATKGTTAATTGAVAAAGAAGAGATARQSRMLLGMAGGLKAFALAAKPILAGAGVFALALGIIGTGLAAATWVMSKALPSLAEGLSAFNTVDGKNLLNVGKGMIAFGAGLAAMGAGATVGAIGGVVANIWDGIGRLTGGRSVMQRLKDFGDFRGINVRGVEQNSNAAVAFGRAMSTLSMGMRDSRRGALRNLVASIWDGLSEMRDVPSMMERLREFGNDFGINPEGIRRNAAAVEAFGNALATLSGAESFRSSIIRDGINVEYLPGVRASLISFSSILDVLDDDFVGNMRRFGATPLPAALEENSRKMAAFAQGLAELGDVQKFAKSFTDGFFVSRGERFSEALSNLKTHITTFSRMGDGVSTTSINTSADMLNRMAGVYERFAGIDSSRLLRTATAVSQLNQALITARQIPAPDTSAAAAASVDTLDQAESQLRRLSEISSNDMKLLIDALIQSNQTTHRKLATINESIQNM